MRIRQAKYSFGRTALVLSLLLGIGMAVNATAQAQTQDDRYSKDRYRGNGQSNQRGRNWERYGNYGGSSQLRETALNAGYNEGVIEGRRTRETGRGADVTGQGTYQRATKDYTRSLGDRELYRKYFREAFEDSYNAERYSQMADDRDRDDDRDNSRRDRRRRNADGYGNFGGSFQLRQTALNAGFNEGVKQGRVDRSKKRDAGYKDRDTYLKATKDYSSRLGDRETYQRYFREAYDHGYLDGHAGF
jgi:hypothetical protein